jgi:ketosteroid isomerase-like protein
VVVLGHLEGRSKQGNEVKVPFVHVWRMEGGQGKRVQALTDSLQLARALGVA